ncbi:MAG: hypothetical protein ACM3W4_06030 [Ignavibacteriales bacterium]
MYRTILAASAALVLGWAGQAAAQTGHVGLAYSRANLSQDSAGDANINVGTAEGAIVLPIEAPVVLSLDGALQNFDAEDGFSTTSENGTAHADFRLGGNALVGGFLGFDHAEDFTLWGGGVEGQYTGQEGGVAAQLAYGQSDDLDNVDFWGERVEGRFYGADNLRFAAHLGAMQLSGDGGSTDLWNVGVDGEYQFSTAPISVWAGYERSSWEDVDLTADVFSFGVRYNFGGSLRDRDAAGANMGGFSNLFGGSLGGGLAGILGDAL